MKAPLSENIKQIFKENKYENFDYLTITLPKQLQDEGLNVEVRFGGSDGTDLMYFLNGENVTDAVFEGINEGVETEPENNPSPQVA